MEIPFGFIFTRHVNSATANEYWKECIRCIRKHYPINTPILIVDDNSNSEYLSPTNVDIPNVQIVQSEFIGRGELLAYYYFHKLRPFQKACILHDSVFVQRHVDFGNSNKDVSFLWGFNPVLSENIGDEIQLINILKYSDTLLELYKDTSKWIGCFGCMSVITLTFLDRLVEKYDMFRLLNVVKNRQDRMYLERVIGVMFVAEQPNYKLLFRDIALFPKNFYFIYIDYLGWKKHKYPPNTISFRGSPSRKTPYDPYPFLKVWSGR
jgi:hypothetical protein